MSASHEPRRAMDRVRKRADFLAVRQGRRAGAQAFLLQAQRRAVPEGPPRVGLTVTRREGHAVERQRIKRRLRAAARLVVPTAGQPGFDYVFIARRDALSRAFVDLLRDMTTALARIHAAPSGPSRTQSEKTGP